LGPKERAPVWGTELAAIGDFSRAPHKQSYSSDNETTQHAREKKKAERSGKGGARGSPPLLRNPTRKHAEEGQAERSGQAQRSGEKKEFRGVSTYYDTT